MFAGLILHLHRRISKHLLPRSPSHTIHLMLFPRCGAPPPKFYYIIPTFRGSRYLVRTTYFYGGINGASDPPMFDQIFDGTFSNVKIFDIAENRNQAQEHSNHKLSLINQRQHKATTKSCNINNLLYKVRYT
ncbi:hypothetical protein KSP40_PGU021913 [Platanthera guangdongensis]|uniref:Uncharacterized protein n=1 Tax=Platanthera guangdongensis TaxID=2320717 RepID=A0ABR2M8Y5_9ASPA